MFAGNSANTLPELAERFLKLGKFCSETHLTFPLVIKLCRFLVQVSGASSTDQLSSLLQTVHAHFPSWSIWHIWPHGAMAWRASYLWVSVSSKEAEWVLEQCLGSPGRRREEGWLAAAWGVHRPALLAERAHLLLTTGAAELCNCSLPGVQGAISQQDGESFCHYSCSYGARFSSHTLKDSSHFSDSFAVRF